jgi:hypothetical protein
MAERISVIIDDQGNAEVEAHGLRGRGCSTLTRAIEQSIGETVNDRKKPEFHLGAHNQQGQQAQAGQ